jgi:ribosomal-protein-alanine N-acetyltransferase
LLLRPFALADATTIRELTGDYEIASTTLHVPHPYPEDGAEPFITRTLEAAEKGSSYTFGIVQKPDGLLIGCIGLSGVHKTNLSAELAYWIRRCGSTYQVGPV